MLKTGNTIIDLFSQVNIFFPLLPVIIIFFRGIYQKESLNYLVILCLLNFCQDIAMQTLHVTYVNQSSIRNIFSLLELIVVVQIFKTILRDRFREMINIITIALLSAMVTYFFVKGADQKNLALETLKNGFIIILTAYSLVAIVQSENLRIFYSPVFWIATGTLFYFAIVLLLDFVDQCCPELQNPIATDKMLLLNVASVARYFFYTLATVAVTRLE